MVEFIILAASLIDGALRIGLVLQHQIDTKSSEVPEELVYQRDEDKALSEHQIYRKALDRGVIDQGLFEELQNLYTARSRVIHRYIISDITTETVFKIACRYEATIGKVNSTIWVVEEQQVQLGVGMTQKTPAGEKSWDMDSMARVKHGAEWLGWALRKRAT